MSRKDVDMLHGSLVDKIIIFAIPVALSGMLQQLLNAVDVAVVGKFAGSDALAAVGTNGPVINIIINVLVGMSVGINVLIASSIGRGDTHQISKAVHTSIALALTLGLGGVLVGEAGAGYILELIHTPTQILPMAVTYLQVYLLGLPFTVVFNFGAAILRSKGDTQRPLYVLIATGVVNATLNVLLVVCYDLGVVGVAAATVTANFLSSLAVIFCLMQEEGPLHFSWHKFGFSKLELKEILRLGVPAGLQGSVFSVSNVLIQAAVNVFGAAAIAGTAVSINIDLMNYFIIAGFGQAAVTFISQNYAAGQYARCKRILRIILLVNIGVTLVTSLSCCAARELLIGLFTNDSAAIAYAKVRIYIVLAPYIVSVPYEILCGALRGMGFANLPTVLMIIGICIFRIFWLVTVQQRYNTYEVLQSVYPVSWFFTDLLLAGAFIYTWHKLKLNSMAK